MPVLYNVFQKREVEVTLPISLYEANITLIPVSDKDITRKLLTNIAYEYRCKNVQQRLSSQIQNKYKKINHSQAGSIPSMQGWFNTGNSTTIIHHINHH